MDSYRVEYEDKMQLIPTRNHETVAQFIKTVRQRFSIPFEIELVYKDARMSPNDLLSDLDLDTTMMAIRVRQRLPVNISASPSTASVSNRRHVESVASHSSGPLQMKHSSSTSRISPNYESLKQQSPLTPRLLSDKTEKNVQQQISHSASFHSANFEPKHRFKQSLIQKTTSEKSIKSSTDSFKFNSSTAVDTIRKKHEEYKQSFYIENDESDTD